jgi:hypothetical protein
VEAPAATMEKHLVWETSILKDKWRKELFYFFTSLENPIHAYGSITNSEKSEKGLLNVVIETQWSLYSRTDTKSRVLKVNTDLFLHKDLLPAGVL